MVRNEEHITLDLSLDGNMFCILMGGNLAKGIAGFGETPMIAFAAWCDAYREEFGITSLSRD